MPRKTSLKTFRVAFLILASMRPRPDAAENPALPGCSLKTSGCRFNEAAARCRGKPAATVRVSS